MDNYMPENTIIADYIKTADLFRMHHAHHSQPSTTPTP